LSNEQESAIRKICCTFYITSIYQYTEPDFYLISSESHNFNPPIACFKRKKLYGDHPDGYMLCDINPEIIGQKYGLGGVDIKQIILASRHQDYSIFTINEWPLYVHIAIPTASFKENDYISKSNLKLIAWGEIYKSLRDIDE
jgi:hypothetical protein